MALTNFVEECILMLLPTLAEFQLLELNLHEIQQKLTLSWSYF